MGFFSKAPAPAPLPPASRNDAEAEAWMDRHMLCECDEICEITDPRPS
jgi:hypothetical protein